MNENNLDIEIRIMKEAFDETRTIVGYAPEEMKTNNNTPHNGDLFITDGGELISLEYQMIDFDENELARYVELAEELYEKNNVAISIYVLCPNTIQVTAPECVIKSEATFNIKLACFAPNPAYDALYHIKEKVDKKIRLDEKDLDILSAIPMMGPKEDRKKLRVECFKIIKQSLEII
ncbi:MAG: hypothetical protein IJQ68_08365 [Methanobrevibacter sp.]|uniref:hypothetical protein n=1 Tax=Methanobrevibacter sp. TaxID=66852 RepID=UPI0025E8D6DD|nr:hypothetical protein [Methanobrevibacter sp.]MBR0271984.1 hypothetical protein [Methanobrevibacter sp.]